MNASSGVSSGLLTLLIWSSIVSSSLARAESGAANLDYEAPADCPTRTEFLAAVSARGGTFDGPDPDKATGAGRMLAVSIRKQDDGFAGTFQMRGEPWATNKREISGPSCAAVVDALAVVTAIELHPAEARAAPAASSSTPSSGAAPASPDLRLRGSTRAFPPRREGVTVGAGTLRFDLQRSSTVYAGATVGLIPATPMPRYDLSLLAANFVTTPEGDQRIAGLVTGLHLGLLGHGTYRSPDTTTDAFGFSFGLAVCQSPHYDTSGFVLLLCSEYGGGLMTLKTKSLDGTPVQSKNVGFGTASAGAELQYNLGALLQVGVKAGGGFSIGQITAERSDGSRIFGSSPWSAYVLAGVGLHF
jgi:hypothetical protein